VNKNKNHVIPTVRQCRLALA